MKNIIRDNRSRPIGIVTDTKVFNGTGSKLLATFNPATNSTYDANGRLLGKGNLLFTKINKK